MKKVLSALSAFNGVVQKIFDLTVGLTLAAIVILIFLQVIYRYVLRHPLSWSEELAQYVFSWLIFAGSAVAYRENKHISVELVVNSIKNSALQKSLWCMSHLLVLFFLYTIVHYSYSIALQLIQLDKIAVAMPQLKLGYVYLIIPVSSTFSLFMVLENILKIFVPREAV